MGDVGIVVNGDRICPFVSLDPMHDMIHAFENDAWARTECGEQVSPRGESAIINTVMMALSAFLICLGCTRVCHPLISEHQLIGLARIP